MDNMDYTVNGESHTQEQVITTLKQLGYHYLGNYQYRENNSNIEQDLLTDFLIAQGYRQDQINATLDRLHRCLSNSHNELYQTNKEFYSLLRYGVGVKTQVGEHEQTVFLIDWKNRKNNRFYIAEEVTLKGVENTRRPDIVLYINGIAVGVIELKRGSVSIDEGIAQLVSNQTKDYNPWFFATSQLLIAGNTSQGLRYGTTLTPAKYFLKWKEDEDQPEDNPLNKYLRRLCRPDRLLEIIYDGILFDGGIKKLPRSHQYFALKNAQTAVQKLQGGIIWHTQGAGKSILMVLLAKWILQDPNARVMVVTDRDELDKQIEQVFSGSNQTIYKATSSANLMSLLHDPSKRLIATLVHKFGQRDVENVDKFVEELSKQNSKIMGKMVIFIDECHRTQSGDLHKYMKAIVPQAVMIGFTGTPLLEKDAKRNSLQVFGGYIHTYLYKEAVEDGVILDLAYESRDVDQYIDDQASIDEWFDSTSKNLNDWQKSELKKHWGTRQKVSSSEARMRKILNDINKDFKNGIPRLSQRGTAILVASSIYEACRYYQLIQDKSPALRTHTGLITSYEPNKNKVSKTITDFDNQTEEQEVYDIYTNILADVVAIPGKSKGETYIDDCKARFINTPKQMKLLIVVDKLLTGFDAPSCSVLYIDKPMQDHGLFQAICRTNRLDTPDKEYGLIIDYRNLFEKMSNAVAVYSSELDTSQAKESNIEIKNRKFLAKEKLDTAIEQLELVMQMVKPNTNEEDRLRYFCGLSGNADDLKKTEPRRKSFYEAVATLFRAYANAKDDLVEIGYTQDEISAIEKKQNFYLDLREKVRLRAGDYLDTKPYDADMRYLIDNYINAKNSVKLTTFENKGLIEVIIDSGIAMAIQDKLAHLQSQASVAETIENNVRSTIIKNHLADPIFQARMSALLDEVIKIRKQGADRYAEYLKAIEKLIQDIEAGSAKGASQAINTPGKKALFSLLENEVWVIALDEYIIENKPADFAKNLIKRQKFEKKIRNFANELAIPKDLQEKIFETILLQKEYQ